MHSLYFRNACVELIDPPAMIGRSTGSIRSLRVVWFSDEINDQDHPNSRRTNGKCGRNVRGNGEAASSRKRKGGPAKGLAY